MYVILGLDHPEIISLRARECRLLPILLILCFPFVACLHMTTIPVVSLRDDQDIEVPLLRSRVRSSQDSDPHSSLTTCYIRLFRSSSSSHCCMTSQICGLMRYCIYNRGGMLFTIAKFGANFRIPIISDCQMEQMLILSRGSRIIAHANVGQVWRSKQKFQPLVNLLKVVKCYSTIPTYRPFPSMQTSISNILRTVTRKILGLTLYDMMRSSHDFEDVKTVLTDRTDWSIELVSTSGRCTLHHVSPLRESLYSFVAASRRGPLSSLSMSTQANDTS